jgi:hypothetical protein
MKSFGILRTNVGLTTNVKVMVSSNYNLFLDSIDSDPQLSSSSFKKRQFGKNTYYDEVLPNFYNQLPTEIAYKVKYDDDNDNMFNTFEKQFDDTYQMGCRNILNNKNYSEEFECFAPLYLGCDRIPKYFIVLRIDGPGLVNLGKDNFRTEIIDKLKCVTLFNLTKATPLGEWLDYNFVSNPDFPDTPFYMDFRSLEFSSWRGIDYEVGGYVSKSFFLDPVLEYENNYFDFEKLVYDGYRNNKVVFPHILNLSFLFDDTPASPDELRKWSINRYMAFYLDEMELERSVNPYILPELRNDVVVLGGNILMSAQSENPFIDDWEHIKAPYIEIGGKFHKVERYSRNLKSEFNKVKISNTVYSDEFTKVNKYFYKIISDVDYIGLTSLSINDSLIEIASVTQSSYNTISLVNSTDLIPNYDLSDVWLIEIDGKYHVIKKVDNNYFIQSDYAFSLTTDKFQYWINKNDPNYRTTINLTINESTTLTPFRIYRCKFTDIKDFDTSIVDTNYSRFEYENSLRLTNTDEPKMYGVNYDSNTNPKDLEDFIINGSVVNLPQSSEYLANGELFRLTDNDLSELWRKNSVRVKWGYQNSISSNDYPYLLNNSFLSDDFNRTCNPFDPLPSRVERNLDYFYSINSSTSSYVHQTLHIDNTIGGDLDLSFKFDLGLYLTASYDYFTSFFGKKSTLNSGNFLYNSEKWSVFDIGDNVIPNITVFRGLKLSLYDVNDIKVSDNKIDAINLNCLNSYQGYKFSILLSKNDINVNRSSSDISIGQISPTFNNLRWYIVDDWGHNKSYKSGDTVSYYDSLYYCIQDSNISDPLKNPSSEIINWIVASYSSYIPLFVPGNTYSLNNFVFNNGEYYYYEPTGNTYSIWNPGQSYRYEDVVLYDNKVWKSSTQSNTNQPGSSAVWRAPNINPTSPTDIYSESYYYWSESQFSQTDWRIIEIWSPINVYTFGGVTGAIIKPNNTIVTPGRPYVIHDEILYQLVSYNSSNEIPGISLSWIRVYSLLPDTNFAYSEINNPLIFMNNRYYICLPPLVYSATASTLENGISIYVNKKYKNVLVNIYVNDNTLEKINNCDRDDLYDDLYSKLTAVNLVNCLSDLTNKYGFSDYLKYVIINEDSSLNIYDFNNITQLSCMLQYQQPDLFYTRLQSRQITPKSLESSQFKSKRSLDNGTIVTIDMINYYNNISLATEIDRVKGDPAVVDNFSGLSNNIYNTLYRYSGWYSPIFYKIQLFETLSGDNTENFKFDTELSEFGVAKERIISKINRKDNILKLRFNPDIKSIYPMLDEFGYTITDYFIFKSTWDYEYYLECLEVDQTDLINLSTNKILK